MSKILKLNSYSQHDELGDRDYMIYEVKYDDGHKEYVSRDVFRNLKALEIIKEKEVNVQNFLMCLRIGWEYELFERDCQDNDDWNETPPYRHPMTKEQFELLKEVLL